MKLRDEPDVAMAVAVANNVASFHSKSRLHQMGLMKKAAQQHVRVNPIASKNFFFYLIILSLVSLINVSLRHIFVNITNSGPGCWWWADVD